MPADPAIADVLRWLAANAVPGFFVSLSVVLVAVATITRSVARFGAVRGHPRWEGVPLLALRFGLGFALIVAAGLIFAGIAGEIGVGEAVGRLDVIFSDALRGSTSPAVLRAFDAVTRFGDPLTLTVLCAVVAVVLVVRRERWLALAWVIAIAGNGILNRTLKAEFERVRPLHPEGHVLADGWSFPSGHSSGALVAYGMLAYVLIRLAPDAWRMPAVLLAAAIAFATGCSRVFLQVHYATDVMAGFASGAAWLAICIGTVEATRLYRGRRRRQDA